MNFTCSVDGCGRNAKRRQLCTMHYNRFRKHGDVGISEPYIARGATLEERLLKWSKPNGECMEWTGTCSQGDLPYGNFHIYKNGKTKCHTAHRVAAHVWKGFDLNSKLVVCHTCDNPKCINPDHLFIGTQKDNMQDAHRKGRMKPHSKLTMEQVREIRKRRGLGESLKAIAKDYPVTWHHIWILCNTSRSWNYAN